MPLSPAPKFPVGPQYLPIGKLHVHHAHGSTQHFQDWFDAYSALATTYGQSIYVVDSHGWELGAYSTPDLDSGKALVWSCEKESDDSSRAVATISAPSTISTFSNPQKA